MTSKRNVKKELGADDKSSMRKLAQKMYLKFESVNAPVEGSQRSLDSSKEAVSFTGQEGVLWLVGGGYAVNETHGNNISSTPAPSRGKGERGGGFLFSACLARVA
jgi:hypothetical protein